MTLGGWAWLRRWRLTTEDARAAGSAVIVIAALIAAKFLLVDALFPRLLGGPAPVWVLVNFQVLTAAVVVGGLVALRAWIPPREEATFTESQSATLLNLLAILIVLLVGSLEIDRAFFHLKDQVRAPWLAKQVAWSIYWSVFAIVAVAAGFRFRAAWERYFGLGLFAFTLCKVALVDLSQVQQGYRILSFVGLGLLLLGTSVLYGKLSPRLLREEQSGAGEAQ